jgi:hypothetical protein
MAGVTSTHALPQAVVPLAQELDDNKVTPGLLGFVIFAVIALALWALMKNMGKQMKKIDFEEDPADRPPAAGGASASAPAQRTSGSAQRASGSAKAAGGAPAKPAGAGRTADAPDPAKPAAGDGAGKTTRSAGAAKPAGAATSASGGKSKAAKPAKPAAGPVKAPRPAPGK